MFHWCFFLLGQVSRGAHDFYPLQDAGVEPKDINEILLVGGMTRMPKVRPTELSRVVGKKKNSMLWWLLLLLLLTTLPHMCTFICYITIAIFQGVHIYIRYT